MKHYTLTNNTKEAFGKTLTQIKRLSDGKLGGWIEKEDNLVQDGSWIDETSIVCDDSVVSGNSTVKNSTVENNSIVYDSLVYDSLVSNSTVKNSTVENNSIVYDSLVYDSLVSNSNVLNNSAVLNNSRVNNSIVSNSLVTNNSTVENNSRANNSTVENNSLVYDSIVYNSHVTKNSTVTTNTLTANLGKHSITVCDDKTSIGCEVHTHDYWLEHIEDIGIKHGYTAKEIELYKTVLFTLIEGKRKTLLTK